MKPPLATAKASPETVFQQDIPRDVEEHAESPVVLEVLYSSTGAFRSLGTAGMEQSQRVPNLSAITV